MSRQPKISRRGFLGGMAALGALGVGGCAGSSGGVTASAPAGRPGGGPSSGGTLPGRGEFVVRDAYVMPMDTALGEFPRGDVHVRNGEIVAVGPNLAAPGAETIDGRGMIALPGLVETHWHMWNTMLRSMAGDKDGRGYFPTVAALGKEYTPGDQYRAVRLAAAEALFSGLTTVHDWCHNAREPAYADADLQALRDAGIRARFSYGHAQGQPLDAAINLDDLARVQREWFARPGEGLLTLGFAGRGTVCPPAVYRREWETARKLGIPITVHADSAPRQRDMVATMFKEGMLGKDVQLVHAIQSSPADFENIARAGSSVSVSPYTELRIGYGFPKTSELLAAGVLVSLSLDTCALCGNADMFGVMKGIQNVANARAQNEYHLLPRRVLELATINGARAMGIGDRVGSLTPGKRADLILVSTTDINMAPFTEPAHLLVEAAQPWNVDTVVVDGRILKRGRKLVALDVEQVVREATESFNAVRRRANWG